MTTTAATNGTLTANGASLDWLGTPGLSERQTAILLRRSNLWPVALRPRGQRYLLGKDEKIAEGKEPYVKAWGLEQWSEFRLDTEYRRTPGAGVGTTLGPGRGPNGDWLADIEGDGPQAEESRRKLYGGEPPETVGWGSTRGGHELVLVDEGRLLAILAKLKGCEVKKPGQPGVYHLDELPGLELRFGGYKADGTVKQLQSACPPTVGTNGERRQWNGCKIIAALPEAAYAVLERIAADRERKAKAEQKPKRERKPRPVHPEANSHSDATPIKGNNPRRTWFLKKLAGLADNVRHTQEGERHNALLAHARTLGGYLANETIAQHGYLTEAEVIAELRDAGRKCGLPEVEIEETIRDGMADGKASPLPWPDHLDPPGTSTNGKVTATHSRGFNTTDLGNAERLIARHGADLRYCHLWKKWLAWDGRHWALDYTAAARRMARKTVRSIYREAANEPDEDRRKLLIAWGTKSEARDRIAAMVALAEAEEGVPVLPEDMDADPWLYNVKNGTLDLRTGHLRPHRREDMLTKVGPHPYEPEAECPTWEKMLRRIFADNSRMIAFMQRLCGLSLVGTPQEQILPILHGEGANGKSTIINALLDMHGPDYGLKAMPELLLARKHEPHPTERAALFGKRLVACVETEDGHRLSEVQVKELTGNDPITARRMREDPWTFKPSWVVMLCTNHRPPVHGTDHAIWRRLRLIPFDVVIPDEEQDRQLGAKLCKELPGILAWCVRGLASYQEVGLNYPEEITDATSEYRREEDKLELFLSERCLRNPSVRGRASVIYAAYRDWAERSGEHAISLTRFGKEITRRGYQKDDSNGIWYLGIGLRQESDEKPETSII